MNEPTETTNSESEPSLLDLDETPPDRRGPVRRLFDTLRPAGLAQAAVILVGGAILVIGLVNAVRTKDVTALVIAGAIVLVFGLVFPAEFGFSWGDARGWAKRADERLQEAAQAETPEEWREAIAEVRAELKTVREARPAATRPRVMSPAISSVGEVFGRPHASHTFQSSSVALHLRSWTKDDQFTCSVETPSGTRWAVSTARPLTKTGLGQYVTVLYPDDFRGSPPLEPGLYKVEWLPLSTSARATVIELLATPPLATDEFTIPGGNKRATRPAETSRDEARPTEAD